MKIALVGNQNCGKTTLFNLLTGTNQKIGNWPGVTIERKVGIIKDLGDELVDLPGIYSLSPYTVEEEVSRKFVLEEKPDMIINIVDSTSIERSLYLTTQLMELNIKVIIAVNMADRLEKMGVKAYKIGSGECNNYPLIEHIAKFGKPMIISTGMNDIESVRKTVEIVEKYNIPYILMHTTNLYPTPAHLVRLGALEELKNSFPNAIIGLSDHTLNNNACLSATALGACVLERHFTDTKDRIGPDIVCSADEKELEELIKGTKEIHQMLGGNKTTLKEEQVTIDFAFATIVTIKPIKKGNKFTKENIWVKRPGKIGIKAEKYDELLGRIATVDIPNDTHILEWMFE